MKASDDLLSVQGTVRTLVDKEGYLVREDSLNGRYRYPLEAGQPYTAGSGLILDNNEFSVDFTSVAAKDDVITYSAGSGLVLDNGEFSVDFTEVATKDYVTSQTTNKGKVKVGEEAISGTFELKYDQNYNIFIDEITLSSNTLDIGQIDFTENALANGEEATFESWINTTNNENILTISVDENITIVNSLPDALSGSFTHVFVRRVYKDANGNIHEVLNYAYSF